MCSTVVTIEPWAPPQDPKILANQLKSQKSYQKNQDQILEHRREKYHQKRHTQVQPVANTARELPSQLVPKPRRCASKGTIMQPMPLKPALPSSSGIDPNQDGILRYEDSASSPATVFPEIYPQSSISAMLTCPGNPPSLYETICMESPSDRSSCVPISTYTSRQTLPWIALKGTMRVQAPVELYLLCAKDLDLQFFKQMRGLNPREYLEKLYKRFLRKFQSSVPGTMFEIDNEEEALQKLLSDIDLCVDGVLDVAGIGKRLQRVQNIFHHVQEVHGWIIELQMHVFAEGREYLVREHDNMALMYQRES